MPCSRHAAIILLVAFVGAPLFAQGILPGDRWPVRGTPRIAGREIERFIVLKKFGISHEREFPKYRDSIRGLPESVFIPVSEDKEAVFYHSITGVWSGRYDGWPETWQLVPGGLYVSKTKPNVIFGYFGDARKPGWVLTPLPYPLKPEVLEKLRVGYTARHRQEKSQTPKKKNGS
jgi:hypothetical protein